MKNIRVETKDMADAIDGALGPLTFEHRQDYALARKRAKPIYKAAAVASFNAWVTAVVAVLSAPFALFSIASLVTTAALTLVAGNEFRGRKRLLQFDPVAPAILGWNQLLLLVLIIGYCAWSIYANLYGANSVTAQLRGLAELEASLGPLDGIDVLVRHVVVISYGALIALSVVVQGLTAWYYFTRHKHVRHYLAETPQWIRELQRSANSPELADTRALPRVVSFD
jgi:hypothetical protein